MNGQPRDNSGTSNTISLHSADGIIHDGQNADNFENPEDLSKEDLDAKQTQTDNAFKKAGKSVSISDEQTPSQLNARSFASECKNQSQSILKNNSGQQG